MKIQQQDNTELLELKKSTELQSAQPKTENIILHTWQGFLRFSPILDISVLHQVV